MIRPFTCLCLAAACGSGLYLYSEKHRTAMLDRDISRVIHETQAVRAQTGLLRAEWALLNEPGRLQGMAEKYLALKPMAPTQFVAMADLGARLPAPISPALQVAAPEAPATAPAPVVPPPAPMAAASPSGLPANHPMVAARNDTPPPAPHAAPRAPGGHQVSVASGLPHGAPLPLAAPQPTGASVYSAMARPARVAAPTPPVVAAVPRYSTAMPIISSLATPGLAAGHALPPPTPYGQ